MRDNETTELNQSIDRLFSPANPNPFIPLVAKLFFLNRQLKEEWPEICGENLAKKCEPCRIKDNILTVRADNSMLANQLFMTREQIRRKVNMKLGERYFIKEIFFRTKSQLLKESRVTQQEEEETVYFKCEKCGAPASRYKDENRKLCTVCEREEKQKQKEKARKLIRDMPWLDYDGIRIYTECDKFTFNAIRNEIMNYYYEKIRYDKANPREMLTGIIFYTMKRPEELTETAKENTLKLLQKNKPKFGE